MIDKKKWVLHILQLLQKEYPDAGVRLKWTSYFELLVAVVLSAQSTDAQVNRVTGEMFKKYNRPEEFAALELSELEELIRGVGLYKGKARNIKKMANILLEQYEGQVPSDFNALLGLPGVGRKTANVMLAVAFQQPGLGVDTHVQRVTNRIGLVNTKNPVQTEQELKATIPIDLWSQSHHLFIFHGRKTCMARKPNCNECVLKDCCNKIM
ncbi:MAG: endonuclease III [Syntrophomonas sp.]|nr:endonuclease III [Syntrophomonas sp.]